jgi:hypothetical protein
MIKATLPDGTKMIKGEEIIKINDVLVKNPQTVAPGVVIGEIIECPRCGHIACVCKVNQEHVEGCKFRLAVTCNIPIECDHGYDVCPECDPCTCSLVLGWEQNRIAFDDAEESMSLFWVEYRRTHSHT